MTPTIVVQVSIVGFNDTDGHAVVVKDGIGAGEIGELTHETAKKAVALAVADWAARR